MQGLIINNISNIYDVKVGNNVYRCNARGKFKNEDIVPLVGDKVELTIVDKEKKEAIIEKIIEIILVRL